MTEVNRSIGTMGEITPDEFADFINSYKREGVENIAYSANKITGELMWLYLMKKYKNDCFVVLYDPLEDIYQAGITVSNKGIPGKNTRILDLIHIFKDCIEMESSLIIIPLELPDHQNMMIYRPTLNTLERYEPHGAESNIGKPTSKELHTERSRLIDTNLEKFFMKKIFDPIFKRQNVPEFRYLRPEDLQNRIQHQYGFQVEEDLEKRMYEIKNKKIFGEAYEGFCQAWSYFYLELCMKFPTLSGKDILDKTFALMKTKSDTEKWLKHIGAYVESSEKGIQKLINSFSFTKILSNVGWEEVKAYRKWYNEQIIIIVSKRYRRVNERPVVKEKKTPTTRVKKITMV